MDVKLLLQVREHRELSSVLQYVNVFEHYRAASSNLLSPARSMRSFKRISLWIGAS